MNILQQFLKLFKSGPGPEFFAQQLRNPSGNFAEEVGRKMNEVNEPLYDLIFDVIEFEENDHVLEIGFGNGLFFERMFSIENSLQIVGIDHSEEMVKEAKRKNRDLIASERLHVQLANSDELPFADQSFDKVFCNMVIYFWNNPEPHLREIHRVLKDTGKFFIGMRTQKSMLIFPFVKYGFTLYETAEWEQILTQNGFKFLETLSKLDPTIKLQSDEVRLESCCVIAEKDEKTII
jgi:ubiquinone/menaquinone biosynthesis C-methylase UbiE